MKNLKVVTYGIFLLALIVTAGCESSSSDKMKDAEENLAETNQDLENAKKEYLADIKSYKKEVAEITTANEQLIKDLRLKADNYKGEMKVDYNRKINDLEKSNEAMKVKLKEYKEEGKDNWDSFKDEFNHDMDELAKALKGITKNDV